MSEKVALFRADASAIIGSGHVMRCLTLAGALQTRGWTCVFSCADETSSVVGALGKSGFRVIGADDRVSCDFLIVDHYGLDDAYESSAREWAGKIFVIDDLADRTHDCDILMDQTFDRKNSDYASLVPVRCRVLCGPEYALLRPQFKNMRENSLARRRDRGGTVSRILISCGTTNLGNITGFCLKAMEDLDNHCHLDVVIGKSAQFIDDVRAQCKRMNDRARHDVVLHTDVLDMASLMADADIALGSGGTTSWERCCLGLPAIVIQVADNQETISRNLSHAGAVMDLGPVAALHPDDLGNALRNMMDHPDRVLDMAYKSSRICDGSGVGRVVKEIENACV